MPMAIACVALLPASARAASLAGPVSGWSSGVPSYISMYEYVPAKVAASPPVLVAAHYCGGSASAMFGFTGMPAIEAAADQFGFIMIFPQTTNPATSADCWDVGSKASLTHNGGGDTQAIAEMVQYEVAHRGANADRVYAMGASSGAMLTEALMAVYPDVFKAGAEFSGVPAGCWSDGWTAASNWGGVCAAGQDTQSAQAWGALVHGMFPGYAGYRPRLQLWHGTADAIINYNNETQAILEWTNVLGLAANPSSTDTTSTAGFTIEKWQSSCSFTVLEAHTQQGGGHTTPIDASSVIAFFGLNQVTGADPQVAACDGGSTGSTGAADGGGGADASKGRSDGGGSSGSSSGGSSSGAGGIGSSTGSSGGAASSSSGSSGARGGSGGSPGATAGSSSGSGSGAGTSGSTGSSGGSDASGGGGDVAIAEGGAATDDSQGAPEGGCSVLAGRPPTGAATAGAGLLGVVVLLGRRRRRR
jgi:poly(hydroxyalkanoate) depolymerase family esterase